MAHYKYSYVEAALVFISYAQNLEDVILWRALKNLDEAGFYIDLGAFDPEYDSVTKAFYDRGWRGINVEPNPQLSAQIESNRERDITVCKAIADTEGSMDMYFLSNPGLSTLDAETSAKHQQTGLSVDQQVVDVTTLEVLWKSHVPPGQEVHFLKIDIEGFEKQALLGNDWTQNRPWIVVIESTLPMTQVESHGDWEYLLTDADYFFGYADGLNRFYVASEHDDLLPALRYPPNVFDDYVTYRQLNAEQRATDAETRAHQAEQRATDAETRAHQAEQRATEAELALEGMETRAVAAESELAGIHRTRSWRWSRRFRRLARTLRKIKNLHSLKLAMRQEARHIGTFFSGGQPKGAEVSANSPDFNSYSPNKWDELRAVQMYRELSESDPFSENSVAYLEVENYGR